MEAKQKLFEETPVPKAVASMAIPTMITMLVMALAFFFNIYRKTKHEESGALEDGCTQNMNRES